MNKNLYWNTQITYTCKKNIFLNSYSKSAQKLSTIYVKETIGANTRNAPL